MQFSAALCADDFSLPLEARDQHATIEPSVGRFERLPKWLNCVPLVLQWVALGIRHGSISLPSAANPSITCGGLVGEGKLEYFDSMGTAARQCIADYISLTKENGLSAQGVILKMRAQNLDFPIVAKPNLGWCGYGVRLLWDEKALQEYLNAFPIGQTLMLQRYLPQEGEAGIFYARHPDEPKGRVIGITLRYFPQVIGDGAHSIGELIANDARLQRIKGNKWHRPDFEPGAIPARGEKVRLSTIGSTRVGGLYCDGADYISPMLDNAMDAIANDMKDFYIGRFDVRYESLEQLRAGKGFTIMEVNGAGSEAVHAWDPKYSIAQSYAIIFAKQRLLFQIASVNRKRGHKPIGLYKMAKLHFQQQKLIAQYPLSN